MVKILHIFALHCAVILISLVLKSSSELVERNQETFHKPGGSAKPKHKTARHYKAEDFSETVKIGEGRVIKGLKFLTRRNRTYFGFLGIPYGKIIERFQDAIEARPWPSKPLDAVEPPELCIQWRSYYEYIDGVEECLKLTVYTPNLGKKHNFPVMVWVSPGGFQMGGARDFRGRYMMDSNVVLVAINHRVGALGFLNTQGQVSGNVGMKDQVLALKWVKKYIDHFGGDPKKVTIAGSDAGGASAHYHLFSPISKGLFHRVISLSGSALNPWAFQPEPLELATKLAENAGCPTDDFAKMIPCLQKLPAKSIIEAERKLVQYPRELDFMSMRFVPSVERNDGWYEKFLLDTPYHMMDSKMVKSDIPIMMGFIHNEGGFHTAELMMKPETLKMLNTKNKKLEVAPNIFYYENVVDPKDSEGITKKIFDYYFKDNAKAIDASTHRNLSNIFTDRLFYNGISISINMLAKFHPVYPYMFTYIAERSGIEFTFKAPKDDAVHTDDVNLMFNNIFEIQYNSKDRGFTETYIKLLVEFMTHGHPPRKIVGDWPTHTKSSSIKYKGIDKDMKLISDPYAARRMFWSKLNLKEHQNQFKGANLKKKSNEKQGRSFHAELKNPKNQRKSSHHHHPSRHHHTHHHSH